MADAAPLPWTIQRVLAWTTERFGARGLDGPRLQAELLIAHALRTDRLHLYMDLQRPLTPPELAEIRVLVQRRIAGEPTQHLVGGAYFFGRLFASDRRALIPRPETEVLVEACLLALPVEADLEILDLCCGSGIVGLTMLTERPRYRAALGDISAEACSLASENARRLGVESRAEVVQGDLLAPWSPERRWDCIVANPPYVETATIPTLQTEVRDHDPHLALDGGNDGLALLRRIAREAQGRLATGGLLALEIGDEQGPRVEALLRAEGWHEATVWPDLAQLDRVVTARSA